MNEVRVTDLPTDQLIVRPTEHVCVRVRVCVESGVECREFHGIFPCVQSVSYSSCNPTLFSLSLSSLPLSSLSSPSHPSLSRPSLSHPSISHSTLVLPNPYPLLLLPFPIIVQIAIY